MNMDVDKIPTMERQIKNLKDRVEKLENEKQQQFDFFKQHLDFYANKVDKLSTYVNELLKSDNNLLALSSIQDNDVNDQVNQVNQEVEQHVRHHVPNSHNQSYKDDGLGLEGNIHPDLQVAQAQAQAVVASAARAANSTNGLDDFDKAKMVKRKLNPQSPPNEKRPKIMIEFIHNPMTVKEIWDEFTKGFKGQPALCELDDRFGKAQWRGDSRSKESKRYQRRKRLCDAINKGMVKYNKSAEEIISYIEEFRNDKSLTWVMNGNLPEDLVL